MRSVGGGIGDKSLDDLIEQIIADTVPIQHGTRNRAVFQFARKLKSLTSLTDADPNELRPYVKEWHSRALPYIRSEPFEETWIDPFAWALRPFQRFL